MKFELKPYNRNVSNNEVLDDVKSVAKKLGKSTLSQDDYQKHGRFNYSTVTRRFGPWVKVMVLAGLEISNYHKIEDSELLEDLRSVAAKNKNNTLSQQAYREYGGKYSIDAFKDHFGSWNSALEKAELKKSKNVYITTDQLFENLEEVWTRLGRQPNYGEVAKPLSKYSKDVYARRFGSWHKALEAFVKSVNEDSTESIIESKTSETTEDKTNTVPKTEILQRKTKRGVNWRLRFLVMRRDNFRCQKCGRSPATDPGIILHIDHRVAWANGGETVMENLETLCSKCNIGKSDLE